MKIPRDIEPESIESFGFQRIDRKELNRKVKSGGLFPKSSLILAERLNVGPETTL
jgi:hypothetical protein